jgi:lipopolysaccharide transport system permease protein
VVNLGVALFRALLSLVILLTGLAVLRQHFPLAIVYLPLVLLPLALLGAGIGWFIASVTVFLRDVGQVITVIVQVLIFVTPVFYDVDRMLSNLPANLHWLPFANPLTAPLENGRAILLADKPPDWQQLGIVTLVGLAVAQLGYAWFMKTKRGFADVL